MNDLILNIKESYNELIHKVTWPTWEQLMSNTVIVLVGTIIISLIVLVLDFISKNALTTLYNINL